MVPSRCLVGPHHVDLRLSESHRLFLSALCVPTLVSVPAGVGMTGQTAREFTLTSEPSSLFFLPRWHMLTCKIGDSREGLRGGWHERRS